jgi:hypothetical protein
MPQLITVAITAYNRPEDLRALLDTILAQAPGDFDVLVVEDASPRQAEIRAVVDRAVPAPDLRPLAPRPREESAPGLPAATREARRVSNCFVLGCVNAAFSPGRGRGRITSPAAAGEVADVRVGG